jgi:5,5'-dehydrodivanillate O-demethylase
MLRKRFLCDLEVVAQGGDPKATIRDPRVNECVPLPIAERKILTEGLTREELLRHPLLGRQLTKGYPFQAGQPEAVREAYEQAMGIS